MIEITLSDGNTLTVRGGQISSPDPILAALGKALVLARQRQGRDVADPDRGPADEVLKLFPQARVVVKPERVPVDVMDGPSSPPTAADRKHYGPGRHPGTGTPQSVHGGGATVRAGTRRTEEEIRRIALSDPAALTPAEWAAYVKARSGYPGLPEHEPTWHEREGLLPGRLWMEFKKGRGFSWYEETYESVLRSPYTPAIEIIPGKGLRGALAIDSDVATARLSEDGYPSWQVELFDKRYTTEVGFFSDERDTEFIYRGMSGEEMYNIMQSGRIESTGQHNLGDEQVGLTYFSDTPIQAATYAAGFAPWTHVPTFETPAYVIKLRRPSKDRIKRVKGTGDSEVGVIGSLPADAILSIYEIRLVAEEAGFMEVVVDIHPPHKVREGSRFPPTAYRAVREVPEEEWSSLVPYYERMQRERKS